jgi:hypothetical protein
VTLADPSDFESALYVEGEERHGHRILKTRSPTIAELLLHIHNMTGKLPHIYFAWTEGNPVKYLLRYLFLGDREVAPVTREVLREAEPDPEHRPFVHVG